MRWYWSSRAPSARPSLTSVGWSTTCAHPPSTSWAYWVPFVNRRLIMGCQRRDQTSRSVCSDSASRCWLLMMCLHCRQRSKSPPTASFRRLSPMSHNMLMLAPVRFVWFLPKASYSWRSPTMASASLLLIEQVLGCSPCMSGPRNWTAPVRSYQLQEEARRYVLASQCSPKPEQQRKGPCYVHIAYSDCR